MMEPDVTNVIGALLFMMKDGVPNARSRDEAIRRVKGWVMTHHQDLSLGFTTGLSPQESVVIRFHSGGARGCLRLKEGFTSEQQVELFYETSTSSWRLRRI